MVNKELVGQTLMNQFRVDAFVEAGGMATVYRVWDLKRNVPLAMKLLHAELADEPAVLRRFQREANALKKLTHPNIVPFYGMYHSGDLIFLLERFVDGSSLKDILRAQSGKLLPLDEILIYFKALCASLGYAHTNGIIHCDVKPGNVMMDSSGSIYLTDFGIARYSESTTTSLGTAGTSAYMAPEQVLGQTVSPATDIYALGVMLFELSTGQRPFRGTEAGTEQGGATMNERMRYSHLHLSPPSPRSINPAIPAKLASVILRALNKKPADRYQNTQEFFSEFCIAANADPATIPDRLLIKELAGVYVSTVAGPTADKVNRPEESAISVPGRSYVVFGIIGAIVVASIVIGLLMRPGLGGLPGAPDNPTSTITASEIVFTRTPSRTRTPKITPTATRVRPTFTPGPTNVPSIPWETYTCADKTHIKLRVGDGGRAVVSRNPVLEQPALPGSPEYKEVRMPLQRKERILVLAGPKCVDDITWWYVKTESSNTGWSQEYSSQRGILLVVFNK